MKIPPVKTLAAIAKKPIQVATKLYNDGLVEGMAKGIGKLAPTKPCAAAVEFLEKLATSTSKVKISPTAALMHLSSFSITFFYLQNIAKSKKIEPERKPFLLIDTGLMTVVSTALGVAIDSKADKIKPRFKEAFKKVYKGISEEALESKMQSFEKMKSLVVFASIVRFAIPILMVPVIGKLVEVFNAKKEAKAKKVLAMEQQRQTQPSPRQLDIKR